MEGMNARKRRQEYPHIKQDWEETIGLIPVDLESTAREAKALQRCRKIGNAADLLRLVLAYAVCDWSFRLVGLWASMIGLCGLSDVAILKRLRNCKGWLAKLVSSWLIMRREKLPSHIRRLRLIDATTASGPGSKGTDYRIHLSLDMAAGSIDGVEVTDAKGGETLIRHAAQPGDIMTGDRGYAHRRGLGSVLSRGTQVVVRTNWQNLPLQTMSGEPVDIIDWLHQVPLDGPGEREVWVDTPDGRFALRLVATRLSQQAAEAARRRIYHQARKKGRTPNQRTLKAAGFIFMVTNLPMESVDAEHVLTLYRIRWQVEMQIKRLKGVLQLDHLRAKDPEVAQTYLLAKLLGALMTDTYMSREMVQQTEWFESVDRPVSPWRLQVVFTEVLRQAVACITPEMIRGKLSDSGRYLRDGPRKRRQQYAEARKLSLTLNAA